MSNDQKPQQPQPPRAGEPIRIAELRFQSTNPHNGVHLGGKLTTNGATYVVQARKTDTDEVRIVYEPWLRRHRVTMFHLGKVEDEVCIPEAWACYREER